LCNEIITCPVVRDVKGHFLLLVDAGAERALNVERPVTITVPCAAFSVRRLLSASDKHRTLRA